MLPQVRQQAQRAEVLIANAFATARSSVMRSGTRESERPLFTATSSTELVDAPGNVATLAHTSRSPAFARSVEANHGALSNALGTARTHRARHLGRHCASRAEKRPSMSAQKGLPPLRSSPRARPACGGPGTAARPPGSAHAPPCALLGVLRYPLGNKTRRFVAFIAFA